METGSSGPVPADFGGLWRKKEAAVRYSRRLAFFGFKGVSLSTPDRQEAELTAIINAAMGGSASAAADMWGMVYEDLRLMAAGAIKQESNESGLQPTQVVHEVFIRLDRNSSRDWDDRRHFFGAAVRAMEQFLIDHARKRKALKRGAGRSPISLSVLAGELACFVHAEEAESRGLIGALEKLADVDPGAAEVTRFRWLMGMTIEQTASLLDRSSSDVRRDWTFARAFLQRCLSESTE